jgi:flagellar hook assembly protein FlgD
VSASLDAAPSSRVTPNPSRGAVDIEWALASAAEAEIRVYDLAGRQVAEVASGRFEAGSHRAHWDGRGSSGAVAPSGWYVIRVIRGSAKTDHRLLLLR